MRLFTIRDLQHLSLDTKIPLYLKRGDKYVRHYFERTDIDYLYDRTVKNSYPIGVFHKNKWYHIDDASHMNLSLDDPVGINPGVFLHINNI